jgi:glycosyltransferase involved in cell wall biosynthesis
VNDFPASPLVALAAKILRKPLILNLHEGSWAFLIKRSKANIVAKGLAYLFYYVIEFILVRVADRIITVSNANLYFLSKTYGIMKDKIQVVMNVPDISEFLSLPCVCVFPQDKFILIYCGNINIRQKLRLVIKSLTELKHKNIVLLIVGGPLFGTESYYRELQELVASLRLSDRVRFIGWVPRKKALSLIASSDVCVLPSEDMNVGFPMKMHEYAALGKPVITTPVKAVLKAYNGAVIVWDGKNHSSLARIINKLYCNEKLRKKIGDKARQLFLKKYCWQFEKDKLVSIYRQLKSNMT